MLRKVPKLLFGDKIGHAKSVGFWFYSAVWLSESRLSLKYLEVTSTSLIYSLTYSMRKEYLFGLPGVWTESREVVGLWPIYNLYKKNANCLLENLLKRSLCGGARWWPFDLLPLPFYPSCFLKKGVGRQHKTSTWSQNVWKCCLPCWNIKLFIAAIEAGFRVL